ncbi:M28 family peptidase [Mucilaginibacter sp. dw_454]|uniref:M28 family peptidase n=1 Tax=Mucilaginibacter sp. dw_454 TaxID=2720079 RepID=UPI001BD6C273|nr:M28 family peptidase [Mucilaginibacter sp. dw_454]
MKKILIINSLLFAAFVTNAQQKADPGKYAQYISAVDARKHLTIIASDAFEGRETGKRGADMAANYIAGEFKKMGLTAPVNGSYFLNVPLVENSLNTDFTVNGKKMAKAYDFYLPGSHADNAIKANEILFIGYGTDAEIGNTDLAGKVLLWINEDKPHEGVKTNTGFRLSDDRKKLIAAIKNKKPAIMLAANPELPAAFKEFRATILGSSLSVKPDKPEPLDASMPMILITDKVADELLKSVGKTFADLLSTAGGGANTTQIVKADVQINYHTDIKDVKAVDVVGYLPGTDLKNEVLVMSAHYDHIGLNAEGPDKVNNGADDDGSGTTAVLELARAFSQAKKDGHGQRRSLLFLANVGEEKGLLGSEYYASHPVFPLTSTITDLNIDMIGRTGFEYQGKPDSADYVYVVGSEKLSKELKQVNVKANDTYTKLKLDYKYDDPNDPEQIYYRSDHYNFAKNGIPIIFFTDGLHADYHQPSDEVSKINFPLLIKRTQLVFYTGWDLANRDTRPVVDGVVK